MIPIPSYKIKVTGFKYNYVSDLLKWRVIYFEIPNLGLSFSIVCCFLFLLLFFCFFFVYFSGRRGGVLQTIGASHSDVLMQIKSQQNKPAILPWKISVLSFFRPLYNDLEIILNYTYWCHTRTSILCHQIVTKSQG